MLLLPQENIRAMSGVQEGGFHGRVRAVGRGFRGICRVMDWIVRRGLLRVPDDVPFEQAAWVEPVNTCLKAIKSLRLEVDDTVLVIGQGPIGIVLGALAWVLPLLWTPSATRPPRRA